MFCMTTGMYIHETINWLHRTSYFSHSFVVIQLVKKSAAHLFAQSRHLLINFIYIFRLSVFILRYSYTALFPILCLLLHLGLPSSIQHPVLFSFYLTSHTSFLRFFRLLSFKRPRSVTKLWKKVKKGEESILRKSGRLWMDYNAYNIHSHTCVFI